MAHNYLLNKIFNKNKKDYETKILRDPLKDLQILNEEQLIERINILLKQLKKVDDQFGDYDFNRQIILVLLMERSFHLNIKDKCISILLNAIYYCSRQSSDNWLRYLASYDPNNGIIIRSNSMHSSNYRKYLYSTIVDNKICVDVNGRRVSLLDAPVSRSQCICGSIGEKMLSFALMTRSVSGLFDLLKYGMNPISDHSGLSNLSLESCLCKSVDWIWKYSHDCISFLALTKQSVTLDVKQSLTIFVILLHTIPPQSLCWNYIRRYLEIGTHVNTYVDTTVFQTCNTLQHLCRLSIRSNLANNWRLPDGLNQLPLPMRIKSYLQLEDIHFIVNNFNSIEMFSNKF